MNTRKHPRPFRTLALFVLIVPLLAMACRLPSVVFGFDEPTPAAPVLLEPTPRPESAVTVPVIQESDAALVNLYARVNPAVVSIVTYAQNGASVGPLGQGSGWLYDNERHIVTNAHVLQGAEQIDVAFSDGVIAAAEVIGMDLNSDLAVVEVSQVPAGVQPLALGDMNRLKVGQAVIAIGNPFGRSGTLTHGIISALGRDIPALTQFSIPQSIQTDAAINPGNSGGPLLNLAGEVIGVNAQIETGATGVAANAGVGFAIPVSVVKRVVPDLIAKGSTEWAYLGVRGGNLIPSAVEAMNLPVEQGAYLSQVVEGGPAAAAGLQGSDGTDSVNGRSVEVGGDVVIAIDGQPVNNFDDLLIYIALSARPGQTVTLTIVRSGQTQDVTVTLGARPNSP
ncbi:MAG: S1C family serine protease [Chloroflexota bacterium]